MPNTREKLICDKCSHKIVCKYKGTCDECNQFATDNNVGDKWISVKDRLPEEDGYYICNVRSFAFRGSFYQAMLKYDNGGFIEGSIYTDDVTHWMPLPEPPKGE